MSLVPGQNANLALPDQPVNVPDPTQLVDIEFPDGEVTISEDDDAEPEQPAGWFDNLIDKIDAREISRITDDLIRGIEADLESRKDWVEDRAVILKLLGTKIELPQAQSTSDSAPVEGMSKVRHPLLLEACLRFQANARSEMLPTDGPVKIRNDDNNSTLKQDSLANAFEKDLNHYLTATASEYYPDTDRMFLMLGLGGISFKKIYFCPLRNRPVSESVDAEDLIVNANATDLRNAKRITHRSMVKMNTIRRLQILGVYAKEALPDAIAPTLDSAQIEKLAQQGINPDGSWPEDRDREIYECYCELDISGYEHKNKGKPSGLEIPYRVTIDVSSRKMLAITRNYAKEDNELPTARRVFVKYEFVPGFGFYGIGLGHILGNTTNAITAGWRELLDAGMFANFPGFLLSDTGARQNTNIFRVPPGGGALVKTGGMPIKDAISALPYNSQAAPSLMALIQDMAATGQRVGGTSELMVGEGRADVPVGTMLAQIEQAQKIQNSVHKRMHQSQSEEFELLVECFREHPDAFWQRNKKPTIAWDEKTFRQALDDFQLVPQADPNTASYAQRAMKIMAVKQLQAAQPQLYDPVAIDTAVLKAIGWNNPEQFFAPPSARAAPPPQLLQAKAEMEVKQKDAGSRAKVADAKVAETEAKIQQGAFRKNDEGPDSEEGLEAERMTAHARLIDAHTNAKALGVKHHDAVMEDQNRDEDRESREKLALLNLAKDIVLRHAELNQPKEPARHDA